MRRIGVMLLTLSIISLLAVNVDAAPVDSPSSGKRIDWSFLPEGDLGLLFSIEGDILDERDLDDFEGIVEASFYSGKLTCSLGDKIGIYGFVGLAQDVVFKSKILGEQVDFEIEDKFFWGLGLSALIYEWEKYATKIFGDVKYRTIKDLNFETVTRDGTQYSKSQLTGTKAEFEEWHIALGVSKKFGYIMPYVGVKYSDVEASAKASAVGATLNMTPIDASENIGAFVGCSITPREEFAIDLQGRFIDEQAFSVAAVFKF